MIERNNIIDTTLNEIAISISNVIFKDQENTIIELKDLSTGNEWTSLKETICAYLNTNGGYVICGVRERDRSYKLTGFEKTQKNESNLIELQTFFFKNDNGIALNLRDHILLDYKNLADKTFAVITVIPLSEDLKYVHFDGKYYERILTQDKIIPSIKLIQHREYKAELEYSKEILPVLNSGIEDLDIDKINQFIIKINTTGRKETVKKDLNDALDFLRRRYCINTENQLTTLGLLLFGKTPELLLENRARLDCYFETGNSIGRNKKYLENDVLNLMEDAFLFVWGHIKVGRSYVGGGRSEPEFPEKLVREIINNAIAHRDYTINKFITIKINPGENIIVNNPGSFKHKMLITNTSSPNEVRRIIAGVPETKNPKLANILKAFDKIESQGIGMATLVSVCLENKIDVPYYDLSNQDSISLIIPSGKLVDDETQFWLDSYKKYINGRLNGKSTPEHELVLAYFLKSEKLNQKRLYTILLSPSNNHFDVIQDLRLAELIYEHPSASSEQIPIYILNEELKITDFTKKIEALLKQSGSLFDVGIIDFDDATRKVLNIIYRYNYYNNQSIKPSTITPELYYQLHGKEIKPVVYESLGRKVRKICGDFHKKGILQKDETKSYYLTLP